MSIVYSKTTSDIEMSIVYSKTTSDIQMKNKRTYQMQGFFRNSEFHGSGPIIREKYKMKMQKIKGNYKEYKRTSNNTCCPKNTHANLKSSRACQCGHFFFVEGRFLI